MTDGQGGPLSDDEIDTRLTSLLRDLKPKAARSSAHKTSYIERHFDELQRVRSTLNYSYKDLADLLTTGGIPTKLTTLKAKMRKLAAQRAATATDTPPATDAYTQRTNAVSVKATRKRVQPNTTA